jgi:Xaa-Pro aminopeptidase
VPQVHKNVFHRVRYTAADPMAWIRLDTGPRAGHRLVVLRDVELEQGRRTIPADEVRVYEDFAPEPGQPGGGLSGDRAIRAAQSFAQACRALGVGAVRADRDLPLIVAEHLRRAGIAVELDQTLGVLERRAKDDREVEALRAATRKTEEVIELACRLVARAPAGPGGVLTHDGEPLTSERVRSFIDMELARRGCSATPSIVAGGPQGADCHFKGSGELRTGEAVIIDVFPLDKASGYYGDCTRMVVHGAVPPEIARMHDVVARAKAAAIARCVVGESGQSVHEAAVGVIRGAGYALGFPPVGQLAATSPTGFCSMPHGTGHGLGLDMKEPPLLDFAGPELIEGDAVTVEPGLYAPGLGGVRLEDLVIVRRGRAENLNTLHEGLDWK